MYLQKVISKKTWKKTKKFVDVMKVKDEKAGSGSESGSISQRYEPADPDPDPHQNFMYPQH